MNGHFKIKSKKRYAVRNYDERRQIRKGMKLKKKTNKKEVTDLISNLMYADTILPQFQYHLFGILGRSFRRSFE